MAAETVFAHGGNVAAGFKILSTDWETETGVALGAQDQLEITPGGHKIDQVLEWAENDASPAGVALRRPAVIGSFGNSGTIETLLPYHNNAQSRLLASLFGTETISAAGGSGTDLYDHLYTFADDSAYYGNYAAYDRLRCRDFPRTKCFGVVMKWETNMIPMATWDLIAKRQYVAGEKSNTTATMANLTFPTTQPATRYLMFHSSVCAVRMNTQTGAALAATDAIYPSGLEITLKRTGSQLRTLANAPYIDETHSNDFIQIMGTLTFPADKLAAHWTTIMAGTKQKLDVTFTGDASGADNYKWLIQFPLIRLLTDGLPKPTGATLVGYTIPFVGEYAYSNPTGMAFALPRITITDPISGYHSANALS